MSNETSTMLKVESIPGGSYIGYVWYSDSEMPEVYEPENPLSVLPLNQASHHLVMEAQLITTECTESYSVKFADGRYVVNCYDLTALDDQVKDGTIDVTEHTYLANRMPTVSSLRFNEYWHPVEDENCMGMKVLSPMEFVFVGFIK